MRPIRTALSLLVLAAALSAGAGTPVLAGSLDSEPVALSFAGGFGYFWARSAGHGFELWRTDGTTAGTTLYQEFQAGTAGSDEGSRVFLIGGRLYVFADDGVNGLEPFTIDPKTGARKLLKNIGPGATGSGPESAGEARFVGINGKVIFPADDGTHGREWWVTDGTRANTKLLADANTDSTWLPQWYAKVGGKLVFNAAAPGTSHAWATDGTPGGTAKISDISPGDQSYRPALLLDGVAIMNGFEDATKTQLYGSDGSSVSLIKQINATDYAQPNGFIKLNGVILFSADDGDHGRELWKTNGTAGGTVRISDINTSGHSTVWIGGDNNQPARIGSTVLFIASDGTGDELWKTDGITVSRVKDINPTGGSSPSWLTVSGGKVFFEATDGVNGYELWVSDGTKKGTFMLKDINPAGDGYGGEMVAIKGGKVLFTAEDGVHGWEPWVSDGTPAGTKLLKDIR